MTDAPGAVNSIVPSPRLRHSGPMRPAAALLCAALLFSACAPMALYYRPGVPVARMQADTTRCEVRALREAPVATRIRQYPPRYIPARRICNSAGECWTRPGYWVEGPIYTEDANAGLRARVMRLCMAEKGYDPVTLPPCPAEIRRATPPAATRVLPRLTAQACVIRNNDGTWQIVTP